jgi:hypothetical protein
MVECTRMYLHVGLFGGFLREVDVSEVLGPLFEIWEVLLTECVSISIQFNLIVGGVQHHCGVCISPSLLVNVI